MNKRTHYIKKILFIGFLVLSSFSLGVTREVYAYPTCSATECTGAGEYICNGGDMCCTGGGCPTYICTQGLYTQACGPYPSGYSCCYESIGCNEAGAFGCILASALPGTCAPCTGAGGGGNGGGCSTESIGNYMRLSTSSSSSVTSETYTEGDTINLYWTNPLNSSSNQTTDWGTCCSSCTRQFRIYANGALQATLGSSVHSSSSAAGAPGVYAVYARASYGNAGSVNSNTITLTVLPAPVTIEGYIWDATGVACTTPHAPLEIEPGDLFPGGDVTISAAANSTTYAGTWDPLGYLGHSYEIPGIPSGSDGAISSFVPAPRSSETSRYTLTCVDNSLALSAGFTNATDPTNIDLGYVIEEVPWFTVFDGDVYGGCDLNNCDPGIAMIAPSTTSGGFSRYLVANSGTAFADSAISVTGGNRTADGRSVQNMEASSFWPTAFSFIPPADAVEITGAACSGMFSSGVLNPSIVYKATADCVQSGIDVLGGSNYILSGDGVATIFVTGN